MECPKCKSQNIHEDLNYDTFYVCEDCGYSGYEDEFDH